MRKVSRRKVAATIFWLPASTAVDNDVHAPDKQVRISGAVTGEGVTAPEPVVLTIEEDDEPPTALTLSLEPATVSEGAGPTEVTVTATFADGARSESTALDIALSAPEGVAAAVAGEDFAEVPSFTLTVPPGQSSGTVTFTFEPLQDAVHEGPEAVNVEATSADLELDTGEPITVTVIDDDTAGIELDPDKLVLEEGGAGEYTVVLTSQPFGEVTIDLAASTGGVLDIEPARLAFDASNWDRPRTRQLNGWARIHRPAGMAGRGKRRLRLLWSRRVRLRARRWRRRP